MDCFYCQVEARLNPSLQGKPIAVVQYQTWKGGGIIAVNYEARNLGVTRRMRGVDAKKHCPEIELVAVPDVRGKADLTKYRDAGREVIAVLNEFSPCVEKASIDEAFLDLTELVEKRCGKVKLSDVQNTFVVGYPDEGGTNQWLNDLYDGGMNDDNLLKLAHAAALVEEIRAAVYEKTGFRCSAGISHNKILAKLSCGLHKPNKQTVLPHSSVSVLYETLPVEKIRSLGGKLGDSVKQQLNCSTMSEVAKFSMRDLQQKFGEKNGSWLYNISRGIDVDPVKPRIVSKSIGCCKNFPAHTALTTKKVVKHWMEELADEVYERIQNDLIANKRRATLITVNTHFEENGKTTVFSRSTALNNYTKEEIVNSCMILISKCNTAPQKSDAWIPSLNLLGISVSKFIEVKSSASSLFKFFKLIKPKTDENESVPDNDTEKSNDPDLLAIEVESKPDPPPSSPIKSELEAISTKDISIKTSESESTRTLIPHASEEPEFASGLNKILNKLRNPSPSSENVYDNPVPSTSKDDPAPNSNNSTNLGFDYSNSFFCKIFKDKNVYVPIKYEKPFNKNDNSLDNSISVCTFDEEESMPGVIDSTMDVEPGPSTSADQMVEKCAECHKFIPLIDFLEHLDLHAAMALQKELNKAEIAERNAEKANSSSSSISSSKGSDNKRQSKKMKLQSPAKKHIPITAFFSVKPSS
ncbi:DNA polymerase eta isoform X2 [Planococcus citri]